MASVTPRISGTTNPERWAQAGFIYTGRGADQEAQYATVVEFDVAVTAEEVEADRGEVGVRVVSFFKAGGEIETSNKAGSVSRVSFRLPLQIRASETKQPQARPVGTVRRG